MTLKFGTDGVRGEANRDLTPELVLALGRAAARVLGRGHWLVGRDTRRSGPLLHAALAAGLAAEGAAVGDLGVLPTPGVAHASRADAVPAAMISASHNPFADNGIKFFAPGGRKLGDDVEDALEAELGRVLADGPGADPLVGADVGRVGPATADVDAYRRFLVDDALEGRSLAGLRVVLDCANGAASGLAPDVFAALGAEVTVLHAAPDGLNINEGCGSTYPDELCRAVVEHRADAGLAFDGDADRVLAADASGHLVDGDQIIAVCGRDLHERGRLANDTVVVTVMTNLGFHHAMRDLGIGVVTTDVGDRYVLEALQRGGHVLGGEQSGHVIFHDVATTGDGMLTGLRLLDVVARSGRPLADLAAVMHRLPQVLRNVRVAQRDPALLDRVADDVRAAQDELGEHGRVLLRPSGTEPVVRVMVEAPTAEQADEVAGRLSVAVEAASA